MAGASTAQPEGQPGTSVQNREDGRSSLPGGPSVFGSARCRAAARSTRHGWCSWHTGYTPGDADAALVGALADHATAVVHRERSTARLADSGAGHQVGTALGDGQRVAAATGILMALHHLNPAQARQLLVRAGDRTQPVAARRRRYRPAHRRAARAPHVEHQGAQRRWYPRAYIHAPAKDGGHRALADIRRIHPRTGLLPLRRCSFPSPVRRATEHVPRRPPSCRRSRPGCERIFWLPAAVRETWWV